MFYPQRQEMKKILLGLFVIVILTGGWVLWATSSSLNDTDLKAITSTSNFYKIPKDTLSIMTYNIGWLSGMTNNKPVERSLDFYETNAESLIGLLETHQVDILALQEIDFGSDRSFNFDQLELVRERMRYPFTAKAVNWDKRYVPFPNWPPKHHFGKVNSGQAIASRLPIQSNTVEKLIKPVDQNYFYKSFYLDRLIQCNTILVGGHEVLLMNVHLEAFSEKTRDLHLERVFELFENAIQKGPTILLGDFNEPMTLQGDSKMNMFYDHPDMGSAITKKQLSTHLEHHFTFSSETPDRKIDYIFYSSKFIEAMKGGTIKETNLLSDHLPVMMRFSLKTSQNDLP